MKLLEIEKILLTEFNLIEGGDIELVSKLQSAAIKICKAIELQKNNCDKQNVIESFVCKHPYKDWDGMSEYCKCKTCGKRIKAN